MDVVTDFFPLPGFLKPSSRLAYLLSFDSGGLAAASQATRDGLSAITVRPKQQNRFKPTGNFPPNISRREQIFDKKPGLPEKAELRFTW